MTVRRRRPRACRAKSGSLIAANVVIALGYGVVSPVLPFTYARHFGVSIARRPS